MKNLENVQGDERDVIFISVGYGKNSTGQVSMNFGPLNRDGGHRRLNVLITRARMQCHVFTNIRGDDIALDRTRARGVSALKTFLQYAETCVLQSDVPMESGREAGSPFQAAVARSLRERGYRIHEEVASGGKFVDIAVVDPDKPGKYVLGIEFDGASYHSARWARDRDRLRELVLTGLGWRLHRIWSTDWFTNPDRELERAVAAIEKALASEHAPETSVTAPPPPAIQRDETPSEPEGTLIPTYKIADPMVRTYGLELHEVSPRSLIEPVSEVVRVESPVHMSEVARRITNAAGLTRVGSRIRETIDLAIGLTVAGGKVVRKGEFLWDVNMDRPEVRSRADLPAKFRDSELISPEEASEAIRIVVERSFGIGRDGAVSEAASLLGFGRTSRVLRESMSSSLDALIDAGVLIRDGENVWLR